MGRMDSFNEGVESAVQAELDSIRASFSDAYEILELIGCGGMGNVYLAHPVNSPDQKMAIKVLHPEFGADETLLARFVREAELLKKVDHPGVVSIYDAGKKGNSIYYAMELVSGASLDEYLDANKFSVDDLPIITLNICEALNAIHAAGIIHRDLKPANIMLAEDWNIKLTDFGIARPESSDLTHHNEIVGSVCYISPEIWIGETPTASVDLYALGIVLYELITGQVPFEGGSPGELMRKHLQSKPVEPIAINPDCPIFFNSLIVNLLAKQKKDRPRSALDIISKVKREYSASHETKTFVAFEHDTQEFLMAMETSSTHQIARQEESENIEPKVTTPEPDKKKSGKLFVLIGLMLVAVVAITAAVLML